MGSDAFGSKVDPRVQVADHGKWGLRFLEERVRKRVDLAAQGAQGHNADAVATLKEAVLAVREGCRISTFALIEDYWGMDWVGFVDQLLLELEQMLVAARLIATSARERRESRGAHFRKDFPALERLGGLMEMERNDPDAGAGRGAALRS